MNCISYGTMLLVLLTTVSSIAGEGLTITTLNESDGSQWSIIRKNDKYQLHYIDINSEAYRNSSLIDPDINENNIFLSHSSNSNASDSIYYNYFKEFSAVFSRSAISEYDYSKLSSYKLTPALFINFDKTPPETYNDNERKNPNVIFNGAVSKKYFLKFINSSLLQNNAVNVNAKKQFVDDTGSYSFIATIKNEKLLILEKILISTPYDMDAEISCTYKFSLLSKDKLMLSDVICAG